jgi:hypothetical protein
MYVPAYQPLFLGSNLAKKNTQNICKVIVGTYAKKMREKTTTNSQTSAMASANGAIHRR